MNLSYSHLLPSDFSDDSRIWIYQSNRLFSIGEAMEIEKILDQFAGEWKSHGTPVKGFGTLFFGQFIILMADEVERTNIAFVVKEKIEILPLAQVQYAFEKGFIDENTLFFDNTIQTKKDFLVNWIIPMGKSWLGKRFLPQN
ncbi:MAG: hypothetical protein LW706_12650 [Chitinophagaceae bacterium]|nr:hypothetical protein [Chitinophagaceae bacterium]